MTQLKDWLVYLLARSFVCLVQALSPETCHTISRWLAVLACDVIGLRRSTVDENIHHVYPESTPAQRRQLARRMWEHLFLMVCEIALAPRKIHETNWRRYMRIRRKREAVQYLLDQRPVILVSGHFGNFELTSYMVGLLGFPTYAIARNLDNPFLDRYINRFRSANGQFILPKDGSAAQVDAVLRSGRAIALLGDQSAGRKGCWVDFLGRPASCHKAVALFTLVSGAPLLVCFGRRYGGPLQIELGVVDIADPQAGGEELSGVKPLTRWYNAALERIILADPDQYWWVHRRWKGEPGRRRKAKAAGAPMDASKASRHAA
ncbi:MAG: lysophospholipid acyltransferase family protein [Planctomycetes bacterium]|nr:lysophospholipid acyltransferase family protein [Planctomycetota bacterium]